MLQTRELVELERIADEERRRVQINKCLYYRPYRKQYAFHGLAKRERLLIAGNQLGKTYSAGMEVSYHATGQYPRWWNGRRFAKPTIGWVAGVSLEGVRDGAQVILLGPVGQEGTGTIPRDRIIQIAKKQNNTIDFVRVKFGPIDSGQETFISFKSYDQGREKFQAASLDWIWLDEEPPEDIYMECITRTNATNGIIFMTFTPLKGISAVVRRYLYEPNEDRAHIQMGIEDAEHISSDKRQSIINSYPAHEREARTQGVPILGSGVIFPIEESLIKIDPMPLPRHFKRLGGMDFGWDHPFGAVELVYDADRDIIYLTREYRIRQRTVLEHAGVLKFWGEIPWAWPHDGLQHSKDSGQVISLQYKKHGLKMLAKRATFPKTDKSKGSSGVEAGLLEMLERMQTGRWKVFSTCTQWFEEKRLYYRDNGKVIKTNDDLIDASRYAMMMLRHAKVVDPLERLRRLTDQGQMGQVALGTGEVTL